MDHCIGMFKNNSTEWIGFDKYEKILYGLQQSSTENLKIVAQSVFGERSNVIYSLTLKDSFSGWILMDQQKQYIGCITFNIETRFIGAEFYLFSIEHKSQNKYNCTSVSSKLFENFVQLFHSSSIGWIVLSLDDSYNNFPSVFRLELNEPANTFSITFMTKVPCRGGWINVWYDEIIVISDTFTSLHVYDMKKNTWSAEKQLIIKDKNIFQCKHKTTHFWNGQLLILLHSSCSLSYSESFHLDAYKLINDSWEKISIIFSNPFHGKIDFRQSIYSSNMLLISSGKCDCVVITNVLSLRDLAFRKIFHETNCRQDLKEALNLPTYLNRRYFGPSWVNNTEIN